MKLLEYFKDFLEKRVNLNETRLSLLDERVESITNFLKNSPTFSQNFQDIIPQGSYAHRTIIRPVQDNDEFDADILLKLNEFEGWDAEDYVQNLYSCFQDSSVYKGKVKRRTRCVVVDYASDFHVDVVPYLERHHEKFITNRAENIFELTDPEKYNFWLGDQNRVAGRNLVKVIRLMKYLRDYKRTFSVKSVIFNVLLGQQVNDAALLQDPHCYDDVPSTLRTVMNHLSEYVQANQAIPVILDPSGTDENFSDRWDQDGWANFRTWMMHYAVKIDEAYKETELDASLKKYQLVFGDQFKKPIPIEQSSALANISKSPPVPYHNSEQRLSDLGISTIQSKFRVRVDGFVLKEVSMSPFYLSSRGGKVSRGRKIRFQVASCSVPEPYEVYWKVLNRGQKAKERDCIRGQIMPGNKQWRIDEQTQFIGPHFVECYIVKDGKCVASDRQEVNIR